MLQLTEEYLEIFGAANESRLVAILFVTARALTANCLHGSFSQ